jgi:hypothetical protein
MTHISRRRSGPTERRVATDERRKEMKEMTLRSRIAVLVVATLLSVAGAFGTSAFPTAQDAKAGTVVNPYNTPLPANCVKITTYPYMKCY